MMNRLVMTGRFLASRPLHRHSPALRQALPFNYVQRRNFFIQTQPTPNTNSMQFFTGKPVLGSKGTVDFPDYRSTQISPIARELFRIQGVSRVFFGSDFITITKNESADWQSLFPQIFGLLTNHTTSEAPWVRDEPINPDTATQEGDSEIVQMIKELLDTRVRPAVQEDGGDIYYVSFDQVSGLLRVRMAGACSGCSSSAVTLKNGVENMLMYYVPEVRCVEAVEDEAEAEGKKRFEELEKSLEEAKKE